MKSLLVLFLFVLVEFLPLNEAVTPAVNCEDFLISVLNAAGGVIEDLHERVHVKPCGKTRCKLRKGHVTKVTMKFTPTEEVRQLHNQVYANIGGIPLPFVGVDGTSACGNVFLASDGTTPAPCPLAPGIDYVYSNSFPIHNFYPSVSLTVHWGLNDGKKNQLCFEVPAEIA